VNIEQQEVPNLLSAFRVKDSIKLPRSSNFLNFKRQKNDEKRKRLLLQRNKFCISSEIQLNNLENNCVVLENVICCLNDSSVEKELLRKYDSELGIQ
jgi:hypothetical protein